MQTEIVGRHLAPLLTAMALASVSCAKPGSVVPARADCRPPSESIARVPKPELLLGDYRLTVVASRGDAAGAAVEGLLMLRPTVHEPEPRYGPVWGRPIWGWVTAPLEAVGASMVYPAQTDVEATPGVVGWYDSSTSKLSLHVGQRWELTIGLELTITRLESTGFAGTWSNPNVRPKRGGYFCAERLTQQEVVSLGSQGGLTVAQFQGHRGPEDRD